LPLRRSTRLTFNKDLTELVIGRQRQNLQNRGDRTLFSAFCATNANRKSPIHARARTRSR